MIFIETSVFTRRVKRIDRRGCLQGLSEPACSESAAGDVIEGYRWHSQDTVAKGHGKRGGARVIYYHFVSASGLFTDDLSQK